MEKRVALYGFLVVLAVGWNASLSTAEPRKITEAEKNFCAEAYRKFAVSTGWRAPRCGTAWIAMDGRCHIIVLRRSSMPEKSLEAR